MKECTDTDKIIEFEYNYVILFAGESFWKTVIGDSVFHSEHIRVYQKAFRGNKLLQFLFRLHWSYSINSKFYLPFKRIWFRRIYKQNFTNNKPLCFVYMGGNSIRFDGGLTKYIRKRSKDNRQVVLHMDLISKKIDYDYETLRNKVDATFTYDKDESIKYNIHYHPLRFYSRLLPLSEPNEFEYDAYFLGNAKDRLEQIIETYHKLHNSGLRCYFLLANVQAEKQIELDGVHYISSISYEENLQNVQKSRCIVEVSQSGTKAVTLRLDEAVTYHRKLLSNCAAIKDSCYYVPETMHYFSCADEIDIDFMKAPIPYTVFNEKKLDLSMDRYLKYIENVVK